MSTCGVVGVFLLRSDDTFFFVYNSDDSLLLILSLFLHHMCLTICGCYGAVMLSR